MVLGLGRSITSTRLTIHAKSRKRIGAGLRPRHLTDRRSRSNSSSGSSWKIGSAKRRPIPISIWTRRSCRLVPPAVRGRKLSRSGIAWPPVRCNRSPSNDHHDLYYALSGLLLASAGWLFAIGALSATGQTVAWTVIFFFASAAASSAYLTVSETFPLEIRALAIAFFYAIGTGAGGVAGPWLFGALIDTGSRWSVFAGYLLGSLLMLAAALVALRWAVAAECKPLESVAKPLASIE
jgi:MFS family permease